MISLVIAYLEGAAEEEGIRAFIEPGVILLILFINAVVGVWQESNAERALEALKEMQSDTAHVLRDGRWVSCLHLLNIMLTYMGTVPTCFSDIWRFQWGAVRLLSFSQLDKQSYMVFSCGNQLDKNRYRRIVGQTGH